MTKPMAKKKRWSLDSLVLIFSIVVIAQLLTYLVPQGQFNREPVPGSSKTMVVAGSYERLAAAEQRGADRSAGHSARPDGSGHGGGRARDGHGPAREGGPQRFYRGFLVKTLFVALNGALFNTVFVACRKRLRVEEPRTSRSRPSSPSQTATAS